MSAWVIDGKAMAKRLLENIQAKISARKTAGMRAPCLAVILVGTDPASAIYVRNKKLACDKVGIRSIAHDIAHTTTQSELLALIQKLNTDDKIDGILVQSPLPPQIDEDEIAENIDANKDVDGFHPYNIGRLAVRQPTLRSCTPFGVIKMLEASNIKLRGMDAVIIGVSNHVGRPMALELMMAGATVTSCHRHTKDMMGKIKQADLVVSAAGKAGLIKGEWIKAGATVIDIGINRLNDGTLSGDVDFKAAQKRAAFITPVPGGVGPMTVATLMENTLLALTLREKES